MTYRTFIGFTAVLTACQSAPMYPDGPMPDFMLKDINPNINYYGNIYLRLMSHMKYKHYFQLHYILNMCYDKLDIFLIINL